MSVVFRGRVWLSFMIVFMFGGCAFRAQPTVMVIPLEVHHNGLFFRIVHGGKNRRAMLDTGANVWVAVFVRVDEQPEGEPSQPLGLTTETQSGMFEIGDSTFVYYRDAPALRYPKRLLADDIDVLCGWTFLRYMRAVVDLRAMTMTLRIPPESQQQVP